MYGVVVPGESRECEAGGDFLRAGGGERSLRFGRLRLTAPAAAHLCSRNSYYREAFLADVPSLSDSFSPAAAEPISRRRASRARFIGTMRFILKSALPKAI